MFNKTVRVISLLSVSLMSFQALSREEPAMQGILTDVAKDVCNNANDVSRCLSQISSLAKMAEITGKGAALCEGHENHPSCSAYIIDSKTIDTWYEINVK